MTPRPSKREYFLTSLDQPNQSRLLNVHVLYVIAHKIDLEYVRTKGSSHVAFSSWVSWISIGSLLSWLTASSGTAVPAQYLHVLPYIWWYCGLRSYDGKGNPVSGECWKDLLWKLVSNGKGDPDILKKKSTKRNLRTLKTWEFHPRRISNFCSKTHMEKTRVFTPKNVLW